jgi:FAD/FMN-containing dehydrogenase
VQKKITDKSGLNQTEIQALIALSPDQNLATLKNILKSAQAKKKTISLRGTQHTQGGHTFYPDGIVVDLANWRQMQLLTPRVLRVQAGATWKDVLAFLNPLVLSVSIMQSDYDFSIGGTVSTNVHGWQANTPPLVSSIKGLHLLLADGRVVYCSRQENPDLFQAVIGGYGLLGIILDVDLDVVPNHIYSLKEWVITTPDFVDLFTKEVANNPQAHMFFGRFKIDNQDFLKQLIVRVYEDQLNQATSKGLDSYGVVTRIVRFIFSQSQGSDFFKNVRWWFETRSFISAWFDKLPRNQLLYHSVDTYVTHDPEKTDLLQEYFIPVEKFTEFVSFLQSMKDDICDDLMNITVRHVCKDTETLLAYAQTDRVAFVLFFRGPRTAAFDEKLKAVAQKMIDKAIELKGTYYLPYRPYPRSDQFQKAYPRYQEFLTVKKKYDPEGLFMNQFYEGYLRG